MSVLTKFNLSYSIYSVYKQSQLQFYFMKIAKAKPSDTVPDGYGVAGNIVHDICEAKINNKELNIDDMFTTLWYKKDMPNKIGLFNRTFDMLKYQEMSNKCINVIDNVREKGGVLTAEQRIEFNLPEFDNILVKGFIDLVQNDNGEIILYDWKTNASPGYELHYSQRMFYSWMWWRKFGELPKQCRWYYASTNKFQEDSFTLEQVKDFEKELFNVLQDIKEKGEDISKYEVGDVETPFNAYKMLCLQEKAKRVNVLKFNIISYGNFSKLVSDEITDLLKKGLDKKLSYTVDGAVFIRRNSNWDGIVHKYNKNKNIFPTGLRPDVIKVLEGYAKYMKRPLEIDFKQMTNYTGEIDVPEKLVDVELRSYQKEAVESFMKNKYGIIKLKTAMGKTILASEIIRRVATNTLWIIDKKLLLEQTKEVLEEVLGVEIGTITEGKINIKDITICTYQTLALHVRELVDYLKNIGLLVIDEVHKASGKSIQLIANLCPNTVYRLGLSATPDLKNNFLEVKSIVGPICYEMKEKDPRYKEFLSDSKIVFIDLEDKNYKSDDREYSKVYEDYIINNDIRNKTIKYIVEKNPNKRILIITKLIKHAEILSKMLSCDMLIGETTKEQREKIVTSYKENNGYVCVGSMQIVSEGWDIKELDIVIQTSAPSSAIKTIQGLGRVLRKHDAKEKAYYYDFIDKNERFFKNASRKRRIALQSEGHSVIIGKHKLEE